MYEHHKTYLLQALLIYADTTCLAACNAALAIFFISVSPCTAKLENASAAKINALVSVFPKLIICVSTATNGGALTESLAYGIKLFVANGMPTNKMMAYNKRNVFFGTDLVSDHSEVKVIDMRDTDGSQNIRFVLRATADVNFAWGAEIVLYA